MCGIAVLTFRFFLTVYVGSQECYDITHGAAIGEAEAPSNLGSNSALEGVDQDLGAKLGSVQEADDLVNLLAVLVSKADLTLDHVRKHGGAEFA